MDIEISRKFISLTNPTNENAFHVRQLLVDSFSDKNILVMSLVHRKFVEIKNYDLKMWKCFIHKCFIRVRYGKICGSVLFM